MRAALVLLLVLAASAPASAAPRHRELIRGISDARYFTVNPELRPLGLERTRDAGARLVRIQLSWRAVAVDPPAGSAAADPDAAGYDWSVVDGAVRDAVAAGMAPLLVVVRAPDAAEGPNRWRYAAPGTWAPDPDAYGAFATAAARRYGGTHPDPLRPGAPLPRVRRWQGWNEPNLPRYLQPQWVAVGGRWRPFAPSHYRRMLRAFHAAVKGVHPDNVIVTAGTAPLGDPRDGGGATAPVRFWRTFLCLDGQGSLRACMEPASFDALAHHPLSVWDPDQGLSAPLDVGVADLHRIVRLLRRAEGRGTITGPADKPLWVTELNWDTRPPDPRGVPGHLQPRWVSRALYRLWATGASVVVWHFLSDPRPLPEDLRRPLDHPAGLYRRSGTGEADDRPKPVLRGFRFPFHAARGDRRRVRVWTLAPRPGVRRVTVERRRAGRWRRVGSARTGRIATLRLRGRVTLRARSGEATSAGWRVGPR